MLLLLRVCCVFFFFTFIFSCGGLTKLQTKSSERTRGRLDTFQIVYDFNTKLYEKKLVYPRVDHPTVFVIKNINRLAYEVTIESKDSSLMDASSTDFMQRVLLQDTTKVKDESDKKAGGIEKADVAQEKDKAGNPILSNQNKQEITAESLRKLINLSDRIAALKTQMSEKETIIESNKKIISAKKREVIVLEDSLVKLTDFNQTNSLKKVIQGLNDEIADIVKINDNEIKRVADISKDIEELQRQLTSAKNSAFVQRSNIKALKNEIVTKYYKIESIKSIHNKILLLVNDPHLNQSAVKARIDFILKGIPTDFTVYFKDSLDAYFSLIQKFQTTYHEFISSQEVEQAYYPYSPAADVKPFYDVVFDINKVVREADYNNLVNSIYIMVENLKNDKNFEIISAPIQPKRDMILFDVKIMSKDSSGKYINDNRSFRYHDYVRGGIRYDFSTGIALTLGLNNESYRLATIGIATDSVEIVKNRDRNAPAPQIAALFHTSIRTKTIFRSGFTIGTTLNTADFNITTVFIGFSAMFGRSEKYIFTAGTALKRTNVLGGKYEVGQRFANGTVSEAILTEQAWRPGPFISFSYNLTQKQKQ